MSAGLGTAPQIPDSCVGLGGVCIDRCVSKGRLASVFRGSREGKPVAVKVYASSVLAGWQRRSTRERQTLEQVVHPCVARLVDAGTTTEGAEYLVTEWVEGECLEARIARGRVPWTQLIGILHCAARGLRALHEAGVLHRDIKPSNIMLRSSGKPEAVIVDLGHALHVAEERLTDLGWTLGSAAYMAPEQAAGGHLDGRVDLYALGVVAYHALTGTLPFEDASPARVMALHQTAPVTPPSRRTPDAGIPQAADDLCMWLLSKKPEQRLPTARVLLAALEATGRSEWNEGRTT